MNDYIQYPLSDHVIFPTPPPGVQEFALQVREFQDAPEKRKKFRNG